MKVFVATTNAGKLAEIRAIFAGTPIELDVYPLYSAVEEDEHDYAGNARRKARGLDAQLRAAGVRGAALADDSGLEVAALGGRPGVFSARYAGAGATWPQRRAALLAEMYGVRDRAARFVCALVLRSENGEELTALGTLDGVLLEEERGRFGFGYDPIFAPSGQRRSLAEFPESEKNAISHRRCAADALLASLRAHDG